MPEIHVCYATPELAPLIKVGGLGDVAGALPQALMTVRAEGGETAVTARVTVALPAFPAVRRAARELGIVIARADGVPPFSRFGRHATFEELLLPGDPPVRCWLIGSPHHFGERDASSIVSTGGPYGAGPGGDSSAALSRWVFFQTALLHRIAHERARGNAVDVLHANDHPTALLPAFVSRLPAGRRAGVGATVLTIHNVGYQGLYPADPLATVSPNELALLTGLDAGEFSPLSPFEFWGRLNPLKAGIELADAVTVVSPTYAHEIAGGEPGLGFGLEGVLAHHASKLTGILNGIDTRVWDPAADPHLVARYTADDLAGKQACKRDLFQRLGLDVARLDRLCLGVVSRLVEQKGIDLIADAAPAIARRGATLAILGSGDAVLEQRLEKLAREHRGAIAFVGRFDEGLAHAIEAGADAFLMPSRYEPCGLNQMYSMRYGTLPIVRATGGLADTVTDLTKSPTTGTGFTFRAPTPAALLAAIDRAIALHTNHPTKWQSAMRRAMTRDFTWQAAAHSYLALYSRVLGPAPG